MLLKLGLSVTMLAVGYYSLQRKGKCESGCCSEHGHSHSHSETSHDHSHSEKATGCSTGCCGHDHGHDDTVVHDHSHSEPKASGSCAKGCCDKGECEKEEKPAMPSRLAAALAKQQAPAKADPPLLGAVLQLAKETGIARKECREALSRHGNDFNAAKAELLPGWKPPTAEEEALKAAWDMITPERSG